jgi:hypothetical protein
MLRYGALDGNAAKLVRLALGGSHGAILRVRCRPTANCGRTYGRPNPPSTKTDDEFDESGGASLIFIAGQ